MVGAETCFCSIVHLEVLLLPTGWDATCSPLQVYPSSMLPLIHLGEEIQSGANFLVKGNNAMTRLEPRPQRSEKFSWC